MKKAFRIAGKITRVTLMILGVLYLVSWFNAVRYFYKTPDNDEDSAVIEIYDLTTLFHLELLYKHEEAKWQAYEKCAEEEEEKIKAETTEALELGAISRYDLFAEALRKSTRCASIL